MPNMVIVNSGKQAAKAANLNGLKLRVRSFKLGASAGYEPDFNANGLRGTTVAEGRLSNVHAQGNIVTINIALDEKLPTRASPDNPFFRFGELGVYLETGELFALAVFPEALVKTGTRDNSLGNRFTFSIKISLNREGASIAFELTEHKNVPEISEFYLLPSPRVSEANIFLVSKENDYGESGVCHKHSNNNKWIIENYPNVVLTGTVTSLVSGAFTDTQAADNWHDAERTALIQFTSGSDAGQVRSLQSYDTATNTFTLVDSNNLPVFPSGVQDGDDYEVLTATPAINQIYLHANTPRLKDHSEVEITVQSGEGLTGGGSIDNNRRIDLDIAGLATVTPTQSDDTPFEGVNIGSNDKARKTAFGAFGALLSLGVTGIRIHTYDIERTSVGFGRLGGSGYVSEAVHRYEGKKVRRWLISRNDNFTSGSFNLAFTYTYEGDTTTYTSASIQHNATSEDVKKALTSLSPINMVAVSGEGSVSRPWRIEFTDAEVDDIPLPLSSNEYLLAIVFGRPTTRTAEYVFQGIAVNSERESDLTLTESKGTTAELAPRGTSQRNVSITHVPGNDVTMCMVILEGGGGAGPGTTSLGISMAASAGSSGGTAIKFVRPDEIPYGAQIELGDGQHSTFIKGHGLGGIRSEDYVTIPSILQRAHSSTFHKINAVGDKEFGVSCSASGGCNGVPHYRQQQVGDIGIRTQFMNGAAPGRGFGGDLDIGGQQGAGTDRHCQGGNSIMGGCGHRYHLDAGIFNRLLGRFETGFASGGAGGVFRGISLLTSHGIRRKTTDFLGRVLPPSACAGDGADSVCIIVEFLGD